MLKDRYGSSDGGKRLKLREQYVGATYSPGITLFNGRPGLGMKFKPYGATD